MLNKKGFTLLELMVAMLILGLLATFVVPNLMRKSPKMERENFIARLNSLVRFAWNDAIASDQLRTIGFYFSKNKKTVSVFSDKKAKVPLKRVYFKPVITVPLQLDVVNFYVGNIDQRARGGGGPLKDAWFYILPDGTTQAVIINVLDREDKIGKKSRPISLVLNPFSAQFDVYDSFKKPQ